MSEFVAFLANGNATEEEGDEAPGGELVQRVSSALHACHGKSHVTDQWWSIASFTTRLGAKSSSAKLDWWCGV